MAEGTEQDVAGQLADERFMRKHLFGLLESACKLLGVEFEAVFEDGSVLEMSPLLRTFERYLDPANSDKWRDSNWREAALSEMRAALARARGEVRDA